MTVSFWKECSRTEQHFQLCHRAAFPMLGSWAHVYDLSQCGAAVHDLQHFLLSPPSSSSASFQRTDSVLELYELLKGCMIGT